MVEPAQHDNAALGFPCFEQHSQDFCAASRSFSYGDVPDGLIDETGAGLGMRLLLRTAATAQATLVGSHVESLGVWRVPSGLC